MGLTIKIHNYPFVTYTGSYESFENFKLKLVNVYDNEMFGVYEDIVRFVRLHGFVPDSLKNKWRDLHKDELDALLWHSIYDGKLTAQECRQIYKAIKKLTVKHTTKYDAIDKEYNTLECWKKMLKFCYQNRVNMYFV